MNSPDVPLAELPHRYHALLRRFDAVRPDCARVARLAVARGETTDRPYNVAFLASLVERAERQTPSNPADRRSVNPEPYTEADLRRHVVGTFRRSSGLWEALTEAAPYVVPDVLDLVRQLVGRLASWGLHGRDVRASTRGPDGEQPPSDYGRAVGQLTTGAARLAKDLADRAAGRDPEGTARRLDRDRAAFERAVEGARRLLAGGPLVLPTSPVERVGDRHSWWAVTGGRGKPKTKRFGVKRGSRAKPFAERDDVLGPFPTKRAATDAAKRADATPEDSAIGLFAPPPAAQHGGGGMTCRPADVPWDRPLPGPMRLALRLAALALVAAPAWAQTTLYPGQTGAQLRESLRAGFTPDSTLDYGPARDSLYTYAQRSQGQVCGVYSGFCVTLAPGADASTSAFEQGINAEHSWPQSRGAQNDPQRGDLHILFPARADVNTSRSNYPYAEVPDTDTDTWFRLDQAQSTIPAADLDQWSERDDTFPGTRYRGRFEPRDDAKGDVARAAAYFATVWEPSVGLFGERDFLRDQLADLQAWHAQDPATDDERARSAYVATLQGAENPFVVDPTLLDRAFTDGYEGDDSGTGGPRDAAVWVNEIHYDNAGADQNEFIEVAGPAGTDLGGWRIVLHSGNGGEAYSDRTLSGVIPNQSMGYGTLSFTYPANGIQNGTPDGLVLVDDNGDVVQALSYEGQMVFVGGPADGLTSEDIGVEESNAETTPTQSLQLTGVGDSYGDFTWAAPRAASPGALNVGQTAAVGTPTESGPSAEPLAVSVYPNPARGPLTVRARGRFAVEVVDALGRRVARAAGLERVQIDVSDLATGVYTARVTGASGVASRVFSVIR